MSFHFFSYVIFNISCHHVLTIIIKCCSALGSFYTPYGISNAQGHHFWVLTWDHFFDGLRSESGSIYNSDLIAWDQIMMP